MKGERMGGTGETRYVCCIPRGCGFNDTLCQIWLSWCYARSTGRRLIIDTRLSGLADDFSELMTVRDPMHPIRLNLNSDILDLLNSLTCHPREIEGKIHMLHYRFAVQPPRDPSWTVYQRRLSYYGNLTRYALFPPSDYSSIGGRALLKYEWASRTGRVHLNAVNERTEEVVVHHQSGGGEDSLMALGLFVLKPSIGAKIQNQLSVTGSSYDAIHVRNTDYSTNYISFLKSLRRQLSGARVLICSDAPEVFWSAQEILSDSDVFALKETTRSHTPVTNRKPLHYQWGLPLEERRRRNIAMLSDLVGLARAKRLFISHLTSGGCRGYSGFSLLASNLHKNPQVLQAWFQSSNLQQSHMS
jgi:hypothetical protein